MDKNIRGGNSIENNLLKAYSEVDKILSFMEIRDVEKVPKKMREMFKNEKLQDYEPNIDKNIPLEEQQLERKTLAILAMLNLNYWCENEEEKEELIRAYSNNDKKRNEELREKYNPDNIFKNKNKEREVEQITEEITAIAEYKKENFIKKLLNKIKRLFTR